MSHWKIQLSSWLPLTFFSLNTPSCPHCQHYWVAPLQKYIQAFQQAQNRKGGENGKMTANSWSSCKSWINEHVHTSLLLGIINHGTEQVSVHHATVASFGWEGQHDCAMFYIFFVHRSNKLSSFFFPLFTKCDFFLAHWKGTFF